ncbi:MAG: 50S ribosomal protein L13 [Bacteroidia bacterium]|nr:50S ribosomal protein L13 [Bacteroidia bacterium]
MDSISYKTVYKNNENVQKNWILVDAENEVLGRLASRVAYVLRGKHKTYFTPHVDAGDSVVIINAEKIKLTGKKLTEKEYIRHTGHPGGQRITTPKELLRTFPERVIKLAVKRMLPKTKLGDKVFKNLFVYAGTQHPHEAQQPKAIKLTSIK